MKEIRGQGEDKGSERVGQAMVRSDPRYPIVTYACAPALEILFTYS